MSSKPRDGKQALAILKPERFAAVFSDMEMPHVSGMELLAEINSDNIGIDRRLSSSAVAAKTNSRVERKNSEPQTT